MGKSSSPYPSTSSLPRQRPRKKIKIDPPRLTGNKSTPRQRPRKKIKIDSPRLTGNKSTPRQHPPTGDNKKNVSTAPPPRRLPTGYASLYVDLMISIAGAFDIPDLYSMSLVCFDWHVAMRPLWKAQRWLRQGKELQHGREATSVLPDQQNALFCFLEGARLGSAACMSEAGLVYWNSGEHEKGKNLYRAAADMGYPTAQCNLALIYLGADPSEPWVAIPLLWRASKSGCARAQYYLANCLKRGHGVICDMSSAAHWYLKSAEGRFPRAMYKISQLYSTGQGIKQDYQRSRLWLKRAADFGEARAQLEHGNALLASGDRLTALYYMELASRAGNHSATEVRDWILLTISPNSRDWTMDFASNWKPGRPVRRL